MSRIDDLIAEFAPEGVPYKTVAEIAVYVRGVTYSKDDEHPDGPVRVLRSNNITLSSNTLNFDDVKTVAETVRVRPDQRLRADDILISAASGSKAHVGKVAYTWDDIDYCFGGFMAVLRVLEYVDSRFLFHLLIGRAFADYLQATLTSTTIHNLGSSTMGGFQIPVPPLEVQREIVRILDHFTELEAELEARRRQYAFYRESLLSLHNVEASWKRLGDVANVGVGQTPSVGVLADTGPYAFVNAGTSESGRALKMNTLGGAVTIPSRGQGGVGIVGYQEDDFWCGPLCYRVVSSDDRLRTRFLYHYLKSIQPSIRGLQQTGGTPALNRKELVLVEIPVLPLTEQERIVSILDKFDALVKDLSSGLPAELAARRKQYEYYRDRLLTFEEAAA